MLGDREFDKREWRSPMLIGFIHSRNKIVRIVSLLMNICNNVLIFSIQNLRMKWLVVCKHNRGRNEDNPSELIWAHKHTQPMHHCLYLLPFKVDSRPNKNCTSRRYFTSSVRAIGSSFQLAITAPQLDFTGYGTATAQSWPKPSLLKPVVTLILATFKFIFYTTLDLRNN